MFLQYVRFLSSKDGAETSAPVKQFGQSPSVPVGKVFFSESLSGSGAVASLRFEAAGGAISLPFVVLATVIVKKGFVIFFLNTLSLSFSRACFVGQSLRHDSINDFWWDVLLQRTQINFVQPTWNRFAVSCLRF